MADYIDNLLRALDDKSVQRRIREIAGGDEKKSVFGGNEEKGKKEAKQLRAALSEKESELELLRRALREEKEDKLRAFRQVEELKQALSDGEIESQNIRRQLETVQKQLEELQEENRALRDREGEYAGCVEEARTVRSYYENGFRQLDTYYRMYLQLGQEVHEDLTRVLSAKSPEAFLCWGVQWGNIEALWAFLDINLSLGKYDSDILDVLSKIFDYLFEQYREINGNYERLDTKAGDDFDEDFHKRSGDSLVAGRISQVLLRGYRGIANKKIKKSVVRI